MRFEDEDTQPWFRQVWPWILIALPASAVVASITTYQIAANGSSGAIRDDYYKEGLAINRSIERGNKAATLGLGANLSVSGKQLRLILEPGQATGIGQLHLSFSHATLGRFDQTLQLSPTDSPNIWNGTLDSPLHQGKWYLALTPPDTSWRLTGTLLDADGGQSLELKPDL